MLHTIGQCSQTCPDSRKGIIYLLMRDVSNNLWPSLIYHQGLYWLGAKTWKFSCSVDKYWLNLLVFSSAAHCDTHLLLHLASETRFSQDFKLSLKLLLLCYQFLFSCLPSFSPQIYWNPSIATVFFLILCPCMFMPFKFLTFISFYQKEMINSCGAFIWVQHKFISNVTW